MARAVDDHPQREKIIEWMLSGRKYTKIAAEICPPLSTKTLMRYAAGPLRAALEAAQRKRLEDKERAKVVHKAENRVIRQKAREEVENADPLVTRIIHREKRRDRWFSAAEDKEDFRALAALDSCEGRDLEFVARLTGRLNSQPDTGHFVVIGVCHPRHATVQEPEIIDVTPIDSGT